MLPERSARGDALPTNFSPTTSHSPNPKFAKHLDPHSMHLSGQVRCFARRFWLAKHPIFDYKITSNMPQTFTYKNDILLGEVEMEYTEEGGIKLKRMPNSQMTLDDYERDEDENDT